MATRSTIVIIIAIPTRRRLSLAKLRAGRSDERDEEGRGGLLFAATFEKTIETS
jgi:hypothetical protein